MKSQISIAISMLAAGLVGFGAVLTVPAMAEEANAAQQPQGAATAAALQPAPSVFVGSNAPFATPFLTAMQPGSSAAPAAVPVGPETGPSPWTGEKLRHPGGGKFPEKVMRWANLVVAVMDEQHIPRKYLPGILAQIQQESSGNPDLVNTYDSNAAAGYPSKGLLQVIGETYQTNAKPGFRNLKYQTVPYTNIWAALHYVKEEYGMGKFAGWNAGHNEAY